MILYFCKKLKFVLNFWQGELKDGKLFFPVSNKSEMQMILARCQYGKYINFFINSYKPIVQIT